jgi:hypothetical protein
MPLRLADFDSIAKVGCALGAGVSRSVAMQIVGHQSEAIYQKYSITNDADVRDALAKVAALPARPGLQIGAR